MLSIPITVHHCSQQYARRLKTMESQLHKLGSTFIESSAKWNNSATFPERRRLQTTGFRCSRWVFLSFYFFSIEYLVGLWGCALHVLRESSTPIPLSVRYLPHRSDGCHTGSRFPGSMSWTCKDIDFAPYIGPQPTTQVASLCRAEFCKHCPL